MRISGSNPVRTSGGRLGHWRHSLRGKAETGGEGPRSAPMSSPSATMPARQFTCPAPKMSAFWIPFAMSSRNSPTRSGRMAKPHSPAVQSRWHEENLPQVVVGKPRRNVLGGEDLFATPSGYDASCAFETFEATSQLTQAVIGISAVGAAIRVDCAWSGPRSATVTDPLRAHAPHAMSATAPRPPTAPRSP